MVRPIMTREFIPPQEFAEYKLLRSLGRGAMGQVYLAHNTLLDRQVALKFLDARAGEGARDRLLVEARAIARLEHPNVARLYQLGATSDHPFLEMEYVPGRPLSEEPQLAAKRLARSLRVEQRKHAAQEGGLKKLHASHETAAARLIEAAPMQLDSARILVARGLVEQDGGFEWRADQIGRASCRERVSSPV